MLLRNCGMLKLAVFYLLLFKKKTFFKSSIVLLIHANSPVSSLRARVSINVRSFHDTRLGVMPRATVEPPIVPSKIRAQPTNQATLRVINHTH